STKSSMSQASGAVDGDKGALVAKIPAGAFYWRLVGRTQSGRTIRSFEYSARGASFTAPRLLAPTAGQSFALSGDQFVVVPISWSQPAGVATVVVEVSSSRTFSDKQLTKHLTQQTDSQVEIRNPGREFVRVIGRVPGSGDKLAAKPVRCAVTKAVELK